jgi:hypothetical protein
MRKKRKLIRTTEMIGTLNSQRRREKPTLKELVLMTSNRLQLKQVELKLKGTKCPNIKRKLKKQSYFWQKRQEISTR